MLTQESINRKKFLMTLGFSGSALMAVLSSCLNEKQTVPEPVSVTPSVPNAPTVSASTVTGSPITVTTESAGMVLVFNGTTQITTFTAVSGTNTYTPTTAGTYTFQLLTSTGTSISSASVTVTAKTSTTPAAPTLAVSSINTNSAISITATLAGTIIVFNGTTQVTTFAAVVGANTYTPSSAGVYTFKLQTANGISGASAAVTVTDLVTTKDLLTLDLTLSANAALLKVGGYIRQSNIVVALVAANTYAAVTQTCSHEGQKQVIYQSGEFYCQSHGARFTTAGVGLNSNGRGGLTVYKTSLVGNILHITA
jgi:nitrite reductase/ring-hydroxylating ferredoxin subunit